MAIREELSLDLSRALSQLDDLERQLDGLLRPIQIPVDLEGTQAINQLERQIAAVEADDIDLDVDVDGVTEADREFQELRKELGLVDDNLDNVRQGADRAGRELQDAGKKSGAAFGAVTKGIALLAAGVAALRGSQALFRFFGDSISAASDFEESLSKTRVVFGAFSKDIEQFASTAPQALGLADAAALEFTATFGNLFVAMGLAESAAADLAPDIVQLGADLASFNNIEVTDALDKLRAGLVGEAEPLRVLGVQLTAASTEAKALELGLVDASGAVTEAGKVQARYAQIVEQTATAQGDFARTADGIANRQRTLAAEFENVRKEIGEALLPAFGALLDLAPRFITDIRAMGESMRDLAGDADEGARGVIGLADIVAGLPRGFGAAGDVLTGVTGAVVGGFTALGSVVSGPLTGDLGALDRNIEGIADSLQGMADSLQQRAILEQYISALKDGVDPALAFANAAAATARNNELTLDGFNGLARIAGLTGARLVDATKAMLEQGEAAGFDADELHVLRIALNSAQEAAGQITPEIEKLQRFKLSESTGPVFQVAQFSEAFVTAAEYAEAFVDGLDDLQGIADQVGIPLAVLTENASLFGDEVERLVGDLGPAALANAAFAESFADLARSSQLDFGDAVDEFELLLTVTNKAGDEIPATVEQMFTDLQEQAQNFADFEAGLLILEAMGFSALVRELETDGPEALGLVDQFLEDLPFAAEVDQLIRQGGNPGQEYIDQVTAALEAGTVTPGLLDLANDFTSQELKDKIANAAFEDARLFGSEFQTALDLLNISLPVDVVIANLDGQLPVGPLTPPSGGGAPVPPTGGGSTGGVVPLGIQNNFFTEPNPTADTARIQQAAAAVISLGQ